MIVCVNGERRVEREWWRVVVDEGWRFKGVPERPTMAEVRLDWGPGRWGIVLVAGEEGALFEEDDWEG